MQPQLSLSMWCSLPNEVRNRFRIIFNIPRSESTEVRDGVIVSDGTTYKDIQELTVTKMQKYVSDESTDFHKLFDKTLSKVHEELLQEKNPKVIVTHETPVTIIIEPEKKRRGRPAKIK